MKIITITLAVSALALPALAQASHFEPAFKDFNDLKWDRTNPELGDASQQVAILHVNPTTKATELIICAPSTTVANFCLMSIFSCG
jgi:hypothetical protein